REHSEPAGRGAAWTEEGATQERATREGGASSAPRRRAREHSEPRARIVIVGGGPGGYEAALVAAQLGAQVTVVDRDGLGGACVLTDCVPSKTLIATSEMMAALEGSAGLGIRYGSGGTPPATVDPPPLSPRLPALARPPPRA